jgi:P pilus assembly chaperone PapD
MKTKVIFSLSLFIFFLIPFCSLNAQGNLLLTPRRVVFEGSKRSEEINLANIGHDTASYVISFVQIRMKEDGTFENVSTPDSGQNFADKNLRFFPRTVRLGPNEAQTIKVQLMRPAELQPGEYRSHIYFRAIPNDKPLGEVDSKSDTTVAVKLIPIFGISIPAIIRVGEPDVAVAMSDVKYQLINDTTPTVTITLNRNGKMSVYGDLTIDHISSYGKVTRVGTANGLAVYSPTAKRKVGIKLEKYVGADLSSGKLRIMYTDQSARKVVYAQQDVAIK